ncbi:MAG: type IV pilus biogenesis/stability protein PilW [Gammaproteobacteria bacterium]|jgi:type IV pilus assembly protein PilF|nr:type IV pilus biogenesis/stability protein PilW [Gammaproteobacteria bacterium]MBT3859082.1 type IV pilus biogenesis/stability protein PilW [Gammaproteobacteria bacterium]MBT3987082.1 type IV pilus biogenesis/stability protein PilW [Gammaproteobacteria bacterium]MBT4255223.1 type IV pilus biogenesis/stability protein PilW [Gammaproteobacteria bacterium]MBT4580653.1 type IV pilus biogenesis/stability protein PilW [Gammaproteobacteria bacterium]
MLISPVRTLYPCLVMLLAGLSLSACITTTTGGFIAEASDEQALDDYLQLAIAYYDENDMQGARRHINNAMQIDGRNSDVFTILALVFQREGDLDRAAENFDRAIDLDRGNSMARNNYAVLLFEMGRYQDAYEQLEQVANDPDYDGRAIAYENLGRAAIQLDRVEDAKNAFQRALQLNSNLYISALESALIEFEQGNYERARSSFQSYLTIVEFSSVPHSPRALLAGIRIEGYFQNQQFVNNFSRVLEALYRNSPEYQSYLEL